MSALLTITDVSKSFGGVQAVSQVEASEGGCAPLPNLPPNSVAPAEPALERTGEAAS